MTERPILFSGPMVRAILAGNKTQTRRVVKPQPLPETCNTFGARFINLGGAEWRYYRYCADHLQPHEDYFKCPYGQPGDRLWVRETWKPYRDVSGPHRTIGIQYAADGVRREDERAKTLWTISRNGKWRRSIHMPRWASRLTLELTDVRVERVRSISYADWCADFCFDARDRELALATHTGKSFQDEYSRRLWDSINAARGYGWEANPWVWALSFKVVPNGQ